MSAPLCQLCGHKMAIEYEKDHYDGAITRSYWCIKNRVVYLNDETGEHCHVVYKDKDGEVEITDYYYSAASEITIEEGHTTVNLNNEKRIDYARVLNTAEIVDLLRRSTKLGSFV